MDIKTGSADLSQAALSAERDDCRADALMALAMEVSSCIRLPELAQSVTRRASELLGGTAAALALARGQSLETVYLYHCAVPPGNGTLRRLNLALTDLAHVNRGAIYYGAASDFVGQTLASSLGWQDLTAVRLEGNENELIGLLLVANRGRELVSADHELVQSLARYAAVALHNSRLFSRMAQSNAQWVEIFDAIGDFIVVHDQAGRVLRVNRSMAEFIGVPAPELIGLGMRSLISVEQRLHPGPCPFCGSDGRGERLHVVLDRTYLVSTSHINATLDEDTQTVHVLKDITDRREAEKRYRELFDNIQEGLFFSTPEGRFVEVNDALVRMLGYEAREELLVIDISTQLYISPERYLEFRRAIQSVDTLRNREEALRRKDGSLVYTLQNVVVVRDAHGKVIQYRGLMLDITELKSFQSELQRQRDFNAKILENTQSLILVVDTAGLISYANQRAYEVGRFQTGQLVGCRIRELVDPTHQEKFDQAILRTLLGLQVNNLELTLVMEGARTAHFSANISPMRDHQGNVNSIVVVMSDVTDELLLQSKLMQTEKMAAVGQLVSGVAHEVNNPLTAILGFADLLVQKPEMPEAARGDLQIIIDEAQRTKQIIQNLLSFARQMPPQREPVQINDLVRRTLLLRAYDFAHGGIEVKETLKEPFPEVVADPHQLQQVFLNVLNNAYDAIRETGDPGVIEIETAVHDGAAEISFIDNGAGIREPQRIFDPFYTTKGLGKGTGLGLSICYGIVREHGGEIIAGNRSSGKGAAFTVRIPIDPKGHAPGADDGKS
ncbi:MAG: PAS domain S-box protein [Candidatus Korobacteraceae bacterium]|jgi:two-component system NtrC family sensor kinase